MSSNAKNATNFRVVMACKVCKDAGKPESEYSNHFVKDREGKVVCPTLLSLQCRYCQKPGHTVSHCPTLQAKTKADEKAKRRQEFAQKLDTHTKVSQKSQSKFGFEFLEEEEESEEVISKQVIQREPVEEFPSLSSDALPVIKPVHAGGTTYAFMAAKTIEDFENEQFEKKIKENALKNVKVITAEKKAPLKASELNWAMLDDSDSDDDW